MEIKIGIGLDNLVFGMSQDDVKSILGEPNKIDNDKYVSGSRYYYNSKMITIRFDGDEDFKLFSIEVFNDEVIFFGQKVIGNFKKDIEKLLRDNGYSDFEYEDYVSFDTLFCDEIYSTFNFEFDRLRSIEFSPLFIDDNVIAWPNLISQD